MPFAVRDVGAYVRAPYAIAELMLVGGASARC